MPVPIVATAAKWHLEAWFFADAAGLRARLGRSLGAVDPSKPDEIQNPKHHLMQLLASVAYTSRVADSIARALSVAKIRENSPSFRRLEEAMRNGRVEPRASG